MTSTHFWLIELGRQSSIWHISFYCISKGYYELKISSKEKAWTRNLQVNDTALFMPLSPLPCNVTHYKNMHCQKVLGYIQYGIKLWKTKLFHCTWCCKMWGSHNSCTENSSPLVRGVSMDHNTPIKTHHHIPEDTHLQHTVFLEQLTGIQMIKKSPSVIECQCSSPCSQAYQWVSSSPTLMQRIHALFLLDVHIFNHFRIIIFPFHDHISLVGFFFFCKISCLFI